VILALATLPQSYEPFANFYLQAFEYKCFSKSILDIGVVEFGPQMLFIVLEREKVEIQLIRLQL